MGGTLEGTALALSELSEAAARWGTPLGQEQWRIALGYLEDLAAHNKTVNLTADDDLEGLILRHFADGLAALAPLRKLLPETTPSGFRLCDVGSGGGFIGMALKIAWPEAHVTLLESSLRKFRFLSGAASRTGLKNLRVVREAGPGGRGFDAALERALAPLPEALSISGPLIRPGGYFLAYQSQACAPDSALQRRLASLSLRLLESIPYRLPREPRDRFLAVFRREEN